MIFSPELEARFEKFLAKYPADRKRSAMIPMLIYAQDEIGSITDELIDEVARRVGVEPHVVIEVLTYYSMLHRKPMGKYHVQICTNISCLLVGGEELWNRASQKLGIGHKEVTRDGRISLEEVECIGACSWAPAIQVNYDFYHDVTMAQLEKLIDGLAAGKRPEEITELVKVHA
jgi:NADH-quinone oxidoreductase subunit E